MIPKIIHYCWFGRNPIPPLAKKCIASWKKYCPDYKIIEWNEDNFDINCCSYVKEAYAAKKWAFVSDVARLYVLVKYGGIYMDTDVQVIKKIDRLLKYQAVSGFESDCYIPTGLMASCKEHPMIEEFLHEYDKIHFICDDGTYDMTTNVTRITNTCMKYGLCLNNKLQTVNGFTLLPNDYLCPKNYKTQKTHITKNTLVIHHFDGSWIDEEEKWFLNARAKLYHFMPKKLAGYTAKFIGDINYHGIKSTVNELVGWVKKRKK